MIKNIRLLFLYLIIISSGDAIGSTSYHIGNSLTNDMLPNGVAAMAGEKDIVHDVGYHIRGGEGLNYIWDNPDDVDGVTDYGNFVTTLPSYEWDFVILQPYYKLGSTLQTDDLAIFDFVNLTNTGPSQNTIFLSTAHGLVNSQTTKNTGIKMYLMNLIREQRTLVPISDTFMII